MALQTDSDFFNLNVSSSTTSKVKLEVPIYQSKKSAFSKTRTVFHSGKILKPKSSTLNLYSKSLMLHLQQPDTVRRYGVLNRTYYNPTSLLAARTMRDSEMNDVMEKVYFDRKLCNYTNHDFDETVLVESTLLPNDVMASKRRGSTSNSPVGEALRETSKSPNSIEDLNKEIEKLFLNNDKIDITSIIWNGDEVAEGRRAPIADLLHCYRGYNRRKKRRSATALGIRNYNESGSSNEVSSPDDNSGCEDYTQFKLIENVDPLIITPVAEKSGIDQTKATNLSSPFSGNKFQLSEDSAFAPIKSIQRPQSTPPENSVNIIDSVHDEVL